MPIAAQIATTGPDAMTAPDLTLVTLDRLDIHPNNVRKTPLGDREQAELTASIKAQGLIEPLACVPASDSPGNYLVVAGGRRLTSLRMLSHDGRLPATLQSGIPCQIFPADSDVTLLSMSENQVRFAMNPADQIEAWRALFEAGYSADDIAGRFGAHPKLVQQRLSLSNLIPEILDLLRDGTITLKVASALSLLGSETRQKAALHCVDDIGDVSAWQIKRLINDDRYTMADIQPQILGLQCYLDAGGHITEDLFSDRRDGSEILLNDPDLVDSLFDDRCGNIETRLLADGWQWVEIERGWDSRLYRTDQLSAPKARIPEDQQGRVDWINTMLDNQDTNAALTPFEAGELTREKMAILTAAEASRYTAEMRAKSGVIVQFRNGYLQCHFARVRRKPQAERVEAKPAPDNTDPGTLYSAALSDDIAGIRTDIVRAELLRHPRVCLDILAFKLASDCLHGYSAACAVQLQSRMKEDFEERADGSNLRGFADHLNRSWQQEDTDWARLRAFLNMPQEDRDNWLTWAVVNAFTVPAATDARRDANQAIAAMLDIDWPARWRPDEAFWKRVGKPAMAEMMTPILGDDWFRNRSGITKRELARLLGEICTGNSNRITATQAEAVRNWQIPGLAPLARDDVEPNGAADQVADDCDEGSAEQVVPVHDPDAQPDRPRFTVKKARLTPVHGPDGSIRIHTEEISSDSCPYPDDEIDTEADSGQDDLQRDVDLSYAEASQSGTRATLDAGIIKDRLAVKVGSKEAAMIDALDGRISLVDMTASPDEGPQADQTTSGETRPDDRQAGGGQSPDGQTDDGLELPAFLRRG